MLVMVEKMKGNRYGEAIPAWEVSARPGRAALACVELFRRAT
jgi:hypothetical protein